MRTREEIEKDIKDQKESIALEKSFNSCSGELSFLYWQLDSLKEELKEVLNNEKQVNERV